MLPPFPGIFVGQNIADCQDRSFLCSRLIAGCPSKSWMSIYAMVKLNPSIPMSRINVNAVTTAVPGSYELTFRSFAKKHTPQMKERTGHTPARGSALLHTSPMQGCAIIGDR